MMSNRIKVLYVSPVGEQGGAEGVLLSVLRFHDRTAFEPTVCLLRPGPLAASVRDLDVPVIVLQSARLRNVRRTLADVRTIRRFVRSEQTDLVFSNMPAGHVVGGTAAAGTPARTVWFQHGTASTADPLDWCAALVPSRRIYVNSRASAKAQAALPRCASRVQVVELGLDQERFAPTGRPNLELLKSLGVPADRIVIAMCARFQRGKGQDVLLRAVSEAVRDCPHIHVVLVGDTQFGLEPAYKIQLQELAAAPGLAGRVTFAGFRTDVSAILDAVDIVVHPHRAPEAFGLSVAEAMLMGKPTVASNLGGPAELIADRVNGLLVPAGDVNAVAQSITQLARDAGMREALGRAARAAMLKRPGVKRMVGELETSFREVVGRAA